MSKQTTAAESPKRGPLVRLHERLIPEPYYCGSIMYRDFGPIRFGWFLEGRYIEIKRLGIKFRVVPDLYARREAELKERRGS